MMNIMRKFLCALFVALSAGFVFSADGPNPEAFRDTGKIGRQNPKFVVKNFFKNGKTAYESAAFVVGNKRVSVREIENRLTAQYDKSAVIMIHVDDKQIVKMVIRGAYKGVYGSPFSFAPGTEPEFKINPEDKTITYSKKYLLPDNTPATFSYTLRSLGDSKVELSCDLGISQERLASLQKDFNLGLSMVLTNYRDEKVMLGNKELPLRSKDVLMKKIKEDNKKYKFIQYAPVAAESYFSFQQITIAPDNPLKKLSIDLPEKSCIRPSEELLADNKEDIYTLNINVGVPRQAKWSMVIDLGEVMLSEKNTPPALGGIDFYKQDHLHVPEPATRNLMPNPSFEQGLRYWGWMSGGGCNYTPGEDSKHFSIESGDAKFGHKSLRIRQTSSNHALSLPLPLQTGKTYTVSCYAKAKNDNATLIFHPVTVGGAIGQFSWLESRNPQYHFKLTNDWTRCSFSFTQKAAANGLMLAAHGDTLVDGIQVEEGKELTEFVSAPVEGLLTTSDPDNNVEFGKPLDAALHIFGKEGISGKVKLKLFNFYRETLFEKEYDFKSGDIIKLPLDDKTLGTGVFFVRAEFMLKGMKPYYDFYRFSTMKFLKNEHASKNIFATQTVVGQISRSDDFARNMMRWGFGSTSWGNPDTTERNQLLKKYGIDILGYFLYYPYHYWREKGLTEDDFKYLYHIT